jgi:alpha-glucosidase
VLAFRRGAFACVVNLSESAVPYSGAVLLASDEVDGTLPPDTAVWLLDSAA